MKLISNLALFCMTLSFSCNADTGNEKSILTDTSKYIVLSEQLLPCETGIGKCETILINRQEPDQPTTIIFPNGGTETSLYLYDTASFSKFIHQTGNSPLYTRYDHTYIDRKPYLDLSNLPDGNYIIHMTACSAGGVFRVKLSTKAAKGFLLNTRKHPKQDVNYFH